MTSAPIPFPVSMLDHALAYAMRGWLVIPLHEAKPDGSCTCSKGSTCTQVAKHPRTKNGLSEATIDRHTIEGWWTRWPTANIAVVTGAESGIWVLDIDEGTGAQAKLDELVRRNGPVPPTLQAVTGGGGRHYFFAHPAPLAPNEEREDDDNRPQVSTRNGLKIDGTKVKGFDVRGDGGYAIVAPSRHKSGASYTFVEPQAPIADSGWLLPIVEPPPAAPLHAPPPLTLITTHSDPDRAFALASMRRSLEAIRSAPEGQRHNVLNLEAFAIGGWVGAGLIPRALAFDEIVAAGLAVGKDAREVERTANDGLTAGEAAPRKPPGSLGLQRLSRAVQAATAAQDRRGRALALLDVYNDETKASLGEAMLHRPVEVERALIELASAPGMQAPADRIRSTCKAAAEELDRAEREAKRKASQPAEPEPTSAPDVPRIAISTDMWAVTQASVKSLVDHAPWLYQRAGDIVTVSREGARITRLDARVGPEPTIHPIAREHLRLCLSRTAKWVTVKEDREGNLEDQPSLPPSWAVDSVATLPEWPLRTLEAIVEAPALRADGSLLSTPGYDETTGLLLDPPKGLEVVVPETPTVEDAECAAKDLTDLLHDFPLDNVSRSGAVAAILTAVARHAIDGPCPMFMINATTPGSGKTLLADVVGMIAEGRDIAHQPYTDNDEEMRKRITSIAIAGTRIVLLDNIDGVLGGAALDAVLTSRTWSDRELGASRMTRPIPMRTLWMASGNNLSVKGDLVRRVVPIQLRPLVERPEERDGFKHPNLIEHVARNRAKYIGAALTILRAYIVAGRPEQGLRAMGSYESWSGLVRSAIVWVGLDDPTLGVATLREGADTKLLQVAGIMHAWKGWYGGTLKTLSEVSREVTRDKTPSLYLAITDACRRTDGTPDVNKLGYLLRKYKGRIIDGLVLIQGGTAHSAAQWAVVASDDPRALEGT